MAHGIVEIEHDLFMVAAARHADHVIDLHLAARADAEIAVDAGVEVDRHGRMAAVGLRPVRVRETAGLDVLLVRSLPEVGLRIVRGLAGRLIRHQQLDHHPARGLGAIRLGFDLHARGRGADAARGQHAFALDLDHADAAVAIGAIAGLGRVAEVRQLDALARGHLEDGLDRAVPRRRGRPG